MLSLGFNGCILDAFDTLTTGIPITVDIHVADETGNETTIADSTTFNLDENDTYKNNKDKINSIKFVKVAYRTKAVTPSDLKGDIILKVKKTDGTLLFSKTISNVTPASYINSPMELQLTQAEIQLMDTFLAMSSNRVFNTTVTIQNLPAGIKTLDAIIDIVFEMEYDL
jgi:hypothetical protein